MIDKRKSSRKIVDEVLEVSDQITSARLGRVVNISAEGLMLLTQEPVVAGSIYQLKMELPTTDGDDPQTIAFGAEAVWTTEASQPESFWTGFRIIDISSDDVLLIDELILDWNSPE
jgi:hypothetical protein